MRVRRLALLSVGLAACASAPPGEGGPVTSAEESALPESDFSRPWAFVDVLAPDLRFDALTRFPGGFVAVTNPVTYDAKAMPVRYNIGAFSVDGLTWAERSLGEAVHARALAYGNGVIVAVSQLPGVGGSILTSTDGKSWRVAMATDLPLMSVRFVEGQFWAFGERGAFFTSRDGQAWVNQSRPATGQLNDIAFGNGRYVIVGNGAWLSSTDGRTWDEHRSICGDLARCPGVAPPGEPSTGAPYLFSVVFGQGVFVTDGEVGPWISSDGLTWTEAPTAVGGSIFSHGRFIARTKARDQATVIVSDDGRSWAARTTFITTQRNKLSCLDHTCLVFPDGILVIPRAGDPAPVPRPPELGLDNGANGQTVTAIVDQKIGLYLRTIGAGQYGDAQLSSPAVRLLDARENPGPPVPGGPTQVFQLVADAPGRAQLHIPHTETGPAFDLTIDVGP